MTEKPWWRDPRQVDPWSARNAERWQELWRNAWFRWGLGGSIFFGGTFLFRLIFPEKLGVSATATIIYGALTAAAIGALTVGMVRDRRSRS